ncbi:hypothetical protein C8R43DRAFT_1001953 [Mycena crocata]|nr:hypothetical protein C8R43DRAFT_1001953 [Mycena crocata]
MPMSGNITAVLGRVTRQELPDGGGGDVFILWNEWYRKIVIVQTVGFFHNENGDWEADRDHWLGKIQTVLHTIDFEHEAVWAYMIDRPSGSRIIQRSRELYHISRDSLWAPRADVSELDISHMWCPTYGLGRGFWRGKEVDITIGFEDFGLRYIENEMRGLRVLRGMDVHYDIVAHLFNGDRLVGILTECSRSARTIRRSDRALVFAAFARLERAFIIYRSVLIDHQMLVDENGRLRLPTTLHAVQYNPDDRETFDNDAQHYHWGPLKQLFEDLDRIAPYPLTYPMRFMKPATTLLATTPSPERLLLIPSLFSVFDFLIKAANKEKDNGRRKQSSKKLRGNPKTLSIGSVSLGPKTHSVHIALAKVVRDVEPGAPPPYSKFPPGNSRPTFRPRLLLLAPDVEDTTSSGSSIVEV